MRVRGRWGLILGALLAVAVLAATGRAQPVASVQYGGRGYAVNSPVVAPWGQAFVDLNANPFFLREAEALKVPGYLSGVVSGLDSGSSLDSMAYVAQALHLLGVNPPVDAGMLGERRSVKLAKDFLKALALAEDAANRDVDEAIRDAQEYFLRAGGTGAEADLRELGPRLARIYTLQQLFSGHMSDQTRTRLEVARRALSSLRHMPDIGRLNDAVSATARMLAPLGREGTPVIQEITGRLARADKPLALEHIQSADGFSRYIAYQVSDNDGEFVTRLLPVMPVSYVPEPRIPHTDRTSQLEVPLHRQFEAEIITEIDGVLVRWPKSRRLFEDTEHTFYWSARNFPIGPRVIKLGSNEPYVPGRKLMGTVVDETLEGIFHLFTLKSRIPPSMFLSRYHTFIDAGFRPNMGGNTDELEGMVESARLLALAGTEFLVRVPPRLSLLKAVWRSVMWNDRGLAVEFFGRVMAMSAIAAAIAGLLGQWDFFWVALIVALMSAAVFFMSSPFPPRWRARRRRA